MQFFSWARKYKQVLELFFLSHSNFRF